MAILEWLFNKNSTLPCKVPQAAFAEIQHPDITLCWETQIPTPLARSLLNLTLPSALPTILEVRLTS